MNIVKERVVTLGFNKENPRNASTPLIQQPCDQPNKIVLRIPLCWLDF